MAGTRDANLRSGDLCEGLGLELLRAFALVAPAPRPEDVGFDAVATLIRPEGRSLYAGDSFLVQVKARSVESIIYEASSLEWLKALRLPFFVLRVDLRSVMFELYTLARVTRHLNYRDQKRVEFYLDDRGTILEGDTMKAGVGIPILRWSPQEAASEEFRHQAYHVLSKWIEFENESIWLRRFRMSRQIKWITNEPPTQSDGFAILQHPAELQDTLNLLKPSIERLSIFAMNISDDENNDLLLGLLLVYEFMRRNGVDPDPNHCLTTLARYKLQGQAIQATHEMGLEPKQPRTDQE